MIPKAALAAGAAAASIASMATKANAPSGPRLPLPIGSLIRPMMMADMPTYEYRCDNGHTFEITQSMSEDALESCTVCGAPAQRILFAPAVHFKGSGFYTTDYARKGNATKTVNGSDPQKSDSKDSKVGLEGSDSKSDSGSSSSSDSSSGSGEKATSKQD